MKPTSSIAFLKFKLKNYMCTNISTSGVWFRLHLNLYQNAQDQVFNIPSQPISERQVSFILHKNALGLVYIISEPIYQNVQGLVVDIKCESISERQGIVYITF